MTISLENLGDGSVADRNFLKLAQLVVDAGGRSIGIRFGSDSLTWPAAGTSSNTKTITHGLGRTPIVVGGWGSDSTTAQFFYCYPFTFTSTQFSMRGVAEAAPGVQTKTFTWVALG